MKKSKSFRFQLISTTSLIIMSFIAVFSLVLLTYMAYYLLILGRIYAMDEDIMTPVVSIIFVSLIIMIIVALIASILCGIAISSRYLKTVKQFTDNVKEIKKEGIDHRLQVEGNDELAQLGNEFNDVLDQLERSLQQQNQFVSDASHELKTPLAIVKGNLDMLQRWGKEDEKILESSLEVSSKEVERLIILCNELLHLTREMNTQCDEAIQADSIIKNTVNDFKRLHPMFKIQVDIKSNDKLWIREEHLKQLMIILLDNAVKYAREDSKQIEVIYDSKQIIVKDYGLGIAEDKLPYIFDRFYKADESRSSNANSFGLGLAIAKRICNAYGFSIKVESKLNEYTIFKINTGGI